MFNSSAILKEEEDYKKLNLAPEQRAIVEQLGAVLNNYLELSKLATLGFIWKSIRDWQVKYSRSISELSNSPPQDRLASVKEMSETLKIYLIKVLRRTEDENTIKRAVDSMYRFYSAQFSKR